MTWPRAKLRDVCSKIGSGATPHGGAAVYINAGTSLIRSQNVYNIKFEYEGLAHITEETAKKLDGVTVAPGDVLLNITGDSVARTCIVPDRVLPARVNQHVAIIRANSELLDYRYLNYYLASPFMQAHMLGLAVGKGASRNAITKVMIEDFSIPLPPLSVQRRIADILSLYDDLIENNRKQIKLLEEAAQRLYREWFIDLRFPGHEHTPIINGVPEGWKRKQLTEVAHIQYGYAFDGSLFNSCGKGMPIIRIRNIPSGTTDDYTTEAAEEQYIVKNGDIVVGMDGEFHINFWGGEDAYLVQRTCRIRPVDPQMKGWLLWAIQEPIKFFEKTVVGATVAHLGKKHIDTIILLTPPNQLYKPFVVFFEKQRVLIKQNRKLTESRDCFLPKLMSGNVKG